MGPHKLIFSFGAAFLSLAARNAIGYYATENAQDTRKQGGLNLQDWTTTDEKASVDIAGLDIDGPSVVQ